MEAYLNLIEAIEGLRKEGYTVDFNLLQNRLESRDAELKIMHDEFKIDKFFRFDDDTNPEDESIIYAISSDKHKVKGILVNGFGPNSEPITNELLKALDL